MFRRTALLLSLGLLLSMTAGVARADIVAYWPLDEGTGTTVGDVMGGWDGTITGDVSWIDGHQGTALDFPGGNNFVNFGNVEIGPSMTLSYWCFNAEKTFERPLGQQAGNYSTVPGWAVYSRDEGEGGVWFRVHGADDAWNGGDIIIADILPKDEWYHLAFTFDGETRELIGYYNGEPKASKMCEAGRAIHPSPSDLRLGNTGAGGAYTGALDEIAIWDHVMDEDEILAAMDGHLGGANPNASRPEPEDGALYQDNWVNLRWKAGAFAVSHDLYIGTSFDDVNAGAEGTFVGSVGDVFQVVGFVGFPIPDGLQPGTTYYWRVDEANDANAASPWKGDVWSFWIQPKTAYNSSPADGMMNVLQDVTLSWTPGMGASLHHVYFGDSLEEVSNAVGAPPLPDATFIPATLEVEKTYYWRVDEFDSTGATHKGDVWSFTTIPDLPITDPDLMGWWTLEEGIGTTAVDWSGQGRHGTLIGDPQWVAGYDGGALEFDGSNYVDTGYTEDLATYTIACWVKSPAAPDGGAASGPLHREQNYQFDWNHADEVFRGAAAMNAGGAWQAASYMPLQADTWYYLAATYDGTAFKAYRDGALITTTPVSGAPNAESGSLKLGRHATAAGNFFTGTVDEARVYNRALTADEILEAMEGDTSIAWGPNPGNGTLVEIGQALPLSWTAGGNAAQHDIYFSTDRAALSNADESDATGIYHGRQSAATFTPAEGVEWGGGPYFWRIDESNADGTIGAGKIWTFAVTDYLIVDDFESYNDLAEDDPASNRIYLTWIDGFGTTTNGAVAGNLDVPLMVPGRSSAQAMPVSYDNAGKTSEATKTLTSRKDWTEQGVTKLVVWFSGGSANADERMFVALGNAVVYHPDDAATQAIGWNEWVIDLQEFANQGANLANVTSITLGFGTRNAPVATGGTGTVEFDDIRLIR